MKVNRIFEDKVSKGLWEQVRKVNEYLSKELDKEITKQLLLRVLERNLLPILVYPDRENEYMLPMTYSKRHDTQINIHAPIPELKLLDEREYCSLFNDGLESFHNQIFSMKEKVEKMGKL